MKTNTYPEMNKKIVEFLRISDETIYQYAADRIEELEYTVQEQRKTINDLINKKPKEGQLELF